jgi:hypothetical protein
MQFEILQFSFSNSFLTAVRKKKIMFFIILTHFGSARLLSLLTANVVQNYYFSIRISHPRLVPPRNLIFKNYKIICYSLREYLTPFSDF